MRRNIIGLVVSLAACRAEVAPVVPDHHASTGRQETMGVAGDSLAVAMIAAPRPMVREGTESAAYELLLSNRGAVPLRVLGLEVLAEATPVLSWGPELLAENVVALVADEGRVSGLRQQAAVSGAVGVEIPPASDAMLFVWIDSEPAIPRRLMNRLRVADPAGEREVEVETVVGDGEPLVLGPPVAGGGWFTANAPNNASPHRRAAFKNHEGYSLPQRFAIDLVRVSERGATFAGEPTENASYHAWGAELLAVADGVVRAIHDGIPENSPGGCQRPMDRHAECERSTAVTMTSETLLGNFAVLEISPGAYVVYAHLKPGSLTVKTGDRVAKGQVLGALGNSGNSTEPHLHLHVCEQPSALACQGLPFAFEVFVEQAIDVRSGPVGAPTIRRATTPIDSAMVHFPPFPDRE